MSPGDWIALAGLLTAQAGAVIAYVLRIERRLASLEALATRADNVRQFRPAPKGAA